MKKYLLSVCLFVFCFFSLFSEIPENFYGIWEGKDRIVFFEESEEAESEIVIILKEFYGWYYDRVVEPLGKAEIESRTRNSATTRTAEQVRFTISPVPKSKNKNAYELSLNYSKNQKNIIPVYIEDGNMFINFYIQDTQDLNFFRGNTITEGIRVSPHNSRENLSCLYFTQNGYFDIRYWLTDMDYEDSKVSLAYDNLNLEVDKHIFSSGYNYSCVSGRSKKIRNVVQPFKIEENTFKYSDDKTVIILDKEPYLTKIADKNTFEDLMKMVKQANSRRKPEPEPLFPPDDLNWHWDLIDYLESNNQLIQEVRKRQEKFAPRPKDLNKNN